MKKQLKTLRQIKDESDWKYSSSNRGSIIFYDNGKVAGEIIEKMFPFFGKRHKVSSVIPDEYYQWKIDCWYYKEVWFQPELQLLEDDLFEI